MDKYERILIIHRKLKASRYPVSFAVLQEITGVSRATVYRDIDFLRDMLGAPLDHTDEGEGGFIYDVTEGERFELPGLWLNSDELHALLATHQLLDRTGDGVLNSALAPFKGRIEGLLNKQSGGKHWPMERVRVIGSYTRKRDEAVFRIVASAVLERKRLRFDYRARSTDKSTQRHVSPQRLTHYRDNWYLDAFDDDKEALRSFSIDRMQNARMQSEAANDLPDTALDAHLASSYGIFSGAPIGTATIVFSAKAARWVADEHWHSQQEGRFLNDGSYQLKLPYSSGKELLMDVLRYGADAEITGPPSLREQARGLLQLALQAYQA